MAKHNTIKLHETYAELYDSKGEKCFVDLEDLELLQQFCWSKNSKGYWRNKNNTSGATGVYYRKDRRKWKAGICVNRKMIWSRLFEDYEDAVKARKQLEEKYFGKYKGGQYENELF